MSTSVTKAKVPRASKPWLRVAGIGFVLAVAALVSARRKPQPPLATVSAPQPISDPSYVLRVPALRASAETRDLEPSDSATSLPTPAPVPVIVASQVPTQLPPPVTASAPVMAASIVEPTQPTAPPAIIASESRRILRSAVAAWSKPGLCTSVTQAGDVRQTIASNFRQLDFGERGSFYVDPRLPQRAELPLLAYLDQAEKELQTRLGLQPPRPRTFVYADQTLMKASACVNEDVVAFYDGALHVIAGRADVLASVLHEYAHHAMFNAGFVAPTWAQEGIAMNIAKERWWRERKYQRALLDNPFGMDDMDRAIAYKLQPAQAVAFYVQSAALVECVMQERRWSLRELFAALSSGAGADSVTYDLPELERRSFLSDCIGKGLNGPAPGQ